MGNITIVIGDITRAKTDAIVNAANPAMLGGGGVDGAIHRAAGPCLLQACREVAAINGVRCPTGQARITLSGELPAKNVIHTVGPRYGIDADPPKLLVSAYRESLNLANAHGLISIAFPAISCGVYGYPLVEAADIAILTCQDKKYADLDIYFYLYNEDVISAWKTRLGSN